MQLPLSNTLPIHRLGRIFQNTTATYKYFWFLSILQIHAQTDNLKISVLDLLIRMVANAWYPVHYFRLSFGKMDSLHKIVTNLHTIAPIPIDTDVNTLCKELEKQIDRNTLEKELKILTRNVPYRFLSPWIDTPNDEEMLIRSHHFENECLYALHQEGKRLDDFYIQLNPIWNSYLRDSYRILTDYTYWNLTRFLQAKNSQLPNLFHTLKQHQCLVQGQSEAKNTHCPFCTMIADTQIICETDTCIAFYDRFPVSPGHALIIPKRHVASYFELTNREREAMNIMLQFVKKEVENRFHPDGYNIGINVNEAAGQSIFHVHMHLIPRYEGDVANPRGGVRGVIPDKQNYPK